jgi:hypothetical protein
MRIFRTATALPVIFLALAAPLAVAPQSAEAQVTVGVSITVPPPPLPVYAQPIIPAEGYIWTPGYWSWGPYGYYWVPGTWVLPPQVGLLWTPGYWAWEGNAYFWRAGYWGPRVGFYGGINYGFGYFGSGFVGGHWDHGAFYYNRTVNNFGSVHITNFYNRTVVHNTNVTRVSFNGGRGGLTARPSAAQQSFARQQHVGPSNLQVQHEDAARNNRAMLSSVNHGRPTIAATPRPAAFEDHGTVRARGAAGAPHGNAPAPAAATVRPPTQNRPGSPPPGAAAAPQAQPRPDQHRGPEHRQPQPAAQHPPQAPHAAPAPNAAAQGGPQPGQPPRGPNQARREGPHGGPQPQQRGPDQHDDQARGGGGGGDRGGGGGDRGGDRDHR